MIRHGEYRRGAVEDDRPVGDVTVQTQVFQAYLDPPTAL